MTYEVFLLYFAVTHAALAAGGAVLLWAALRRVRASRSSAALLAGAAAAVLLVVVLDFPVFRGRGSGRTESWPLWAVALSAAERDLGWTIPGARSGDAFPDRARWGLFAFAAACGSLGALPGPRGGRDRPRRPAARVKDGANVGRGESAGNLAPAANAA